MTAQQRGGSMVFCGVLIVFAAVGGMENPDHSQYLALQTLTAVLGLFCMARGCRLIEDLDV